MAAGAPAFGSSSVPHTVMPSVVEAPGRAAGALSVPHNHPGPSTSLGMTAHSTVMPSVVEAPGRAAGAPAFGSSSVPHNLKAQTEVRTDAEPTWRAAGPPQRGAAVPPTCSRKGGATAQPATQAARGE